MKKSMVILCGVLLIFGVAGMVRTANATLVGYWNFDENTGITANDSSGYNNTGTVMGGAAWVQGKYGSALSLDGYNDYVNVPHSESINLTQWTVSFWVSFYDLSRTYVLMDKRNGGDHHNYEFVLYHDDPLSGDYLSANIGDGSTSGNYTNAAYSPVTMNPNQFYYIAATYDQSVLTLYLDGNLMNSRTNLSMPNIVGTADLHIGTHGYEWMSPTYGIVDEVRIYNTALTQAEIIADMNPVPEPATLLLLGSGLAGLAGLTRRFRKR